MSSIRQKIQQQQKQKAVKRPREPSDLDGSSLPAIEQQQEGEAEEHSECSDAFDSDDENHPVIEFQRGTTVRGATCFWHQGKTKGTSHKNYFYNLGFLFFLPKLDFFIILSKNLNISRFSLHTEVGQPLPLFEPRLSGNSKNDG